MIRLKASYTICDKYEGNNGHIIRFATILKHPEGKADHFLEAVIKRKAPLLWSTIVDKFWDSITCLESSVQLLQLKDQHLNDWPKILFGCRPLDNGQAIQEVWQELMISNPEVTAHLE